MGYRPKHDPVNIFKVNMKSLVTFLLSTALCFFMISQTCKGQDYSSCGLRSINTNIRLKIFGGIRSRPGMWPWQVAIYRKRDGQRSRFRCGGALINSRWIVSAAHCFYKSSVEQHINYRYTIKAGEHNILSKDPYEQERNAFAIHKHPNFIAETYENDIALVELDQGVRMGPSVRAICLPKVHENVSLPGEVVSVAGWGFTSKGVSSPVLLYSAYQIQSNRKCRRATSYHFNESLMFCAGDGKGGKDTCKGDSGGSTVRPVNRNGRHRWVMVGLVSWGEGCGIKGKYGYYTRIEPFVEWIQSKINGSILSCGNPGNIPNGWFIGSEFLVGSTIKWKCNQGYQLKGRSKSRCKRSRKWTRAPKCHKVKCRDTGEPRGGVRRPRKNKYYYKDKVRFTCKTNYTIVGKSTVICQSDGMWSGFPPACLAPCKDPGVPEGGIRLDHSFRHGQTVRFMCKKKNQPPSVIFTICTNGRWSRDTPRCNSGCGDPGTPTNGKKQGNDFTSNKKVYFTCNRGYRRVGPRYLRCQSNQRWSGKMPTCQPLFCIKPKPPANAFVYSTWNLKENYRINELVDFRCKEGYFSSGLSFQRCLVNGWSKTSLRCSAISCGDPGTPTNGRRHGNVFTLSKKEYFACNQGYTRLGPEYRQCQKNQTWSHKTPTCIIVDCGRLPAPQHGKKIEETSTTFGGKVVFQCNQSDYEMKGSAQRRCQENGKWSGNVTTCEENCGSALGMEKKKIPDQNIRASSFRNQFHTAKEARLNGRSAWCSGRELQPYLEIDFGKPYKIKALGTQGSTYRNIWVKAYSLGSNLAGSSFHTYREDSRERIFRGNRDSSTIVRQNLHSRLIARRIRIISIKSGGYYYIPACMRVEIYGCDLPLDCVVVGSRVVARWYPNSRGGYVYLKGYMMSKKNRRVELENESHYGTYQHRNFPDYVSLPFVLDVPPKHEELKLGTRVLAPWSFRYYTGTIITPRDRYNKYRVRTDDNDTGYFAIDQIRLLKTANFCK